MVANINLIKQESYSVVNLEKQLSQSFLSRKAQLIHVPIRLKHG